MLNRQFYFACAAAALSAVHFFTEGLAVSFSIHLQTTGQHQTNHQKLNMTYALTAGNCVL